MHTSRRLPALIKCNRITRLPSSLRLTPFLPRSSSRSSSNVDTESALEDPIPPKPTWSVHALLESYPRPRISHQELTKLHTLSALVPPKEGSEEAESIRGELEELIRLVEAVKLVDTSKLDVNQDIEGVEVGSNALKSPIPDGRIWEEGRGMKLSTNTREVEFEDPEVESGKELLKHAKFTKVGFYVVEADRRKK